MVSAIKRQASSLPLGEGEVAPMGRERQRSNEDRFRERKKTIPLPQDSAHGQQVSSKSCFLSAFLFNKDTSQQKRHHLVCEVNHPWGKNSRDRSWLPLLRSTWARLSCLASLFSRTDKETGCSPLSLVCASLPLAWLGQDFLFSLLRQS